MCGRYTLSTPGEVIADLFDLPEAPEVEARYNVAPTQEVAAIRVEEAGAPRRFVRLRWGLVPHWADDPGIGNRMINARAETAAKKPAFRTSFKRARCAVLADGFYEWQKVPGGAKQPWYYRLKSGEPFAFAGLWARWEPKNGDDGGPIESCTILTTGSNELVRRVHPRMPVILEPEDLDLWLDPKLADRERLEAVLDPLEASGMIAYPVSRRVNSPATDDPSLLEPQGEAERAAEGSTAGKQRDLFP
ncbi:MAG: SOS response-associated peptidase [Acidobacteriota bacterium]